MPASYSKPYSGRPALYRRPGDRPPAWRCVCAGMKNYRRHREPWECLPMTATTEKKVLAWLREEFGR